jgi:hypothetical protein
MVSSATLAAPVTLNGEALETIKRCEDDKTHGEGDKTIILRLFEHYGGHARATLKMWAVTHCGAFDPLDRMELQFMNMVFEQIDNLSLLDIKSSAAISLQYLLEDHVHELKLHSIKGVKGETASAVKLDFRGYEIKTVRLTVVPEKRKRKGSAGSWVKRPTFIHFTIYSIFPTYYKFLDIIQRDLPRYRSELNPWARSPTDGRPGKEEAQGFCGLMG